MLTRRELDEVTVVLENESKFYNWCQSYIKTCTHIRWYEALRRFYRSELTVRLCVAQAEHLKSYFEWRWFTDQKTPSPLYTGPYKKDPGKPMPVCSNKDKLALLRSMYGGSSSPPSPISVPLPHKMSIWSGINEAIDECNNSFCPTNYITPEFNSMAPLVFKTVFTLNNQDLSKLSNEDIYAAIQAEEARIEKMKTIKNQPKSLKAEIAAAETQLLQLVEHLDSK